MSLTTNGIGKTIQRFKFLQQLLTLNNYRRNYLQCVWFYSENNKPCSEHNTSPQPKPSQHCTELSRPLDNRNKRNLFRKELLPEWKINIISKYEKPKENMDTTRTEIFNLMKILWVIYLTMAAYGITIIMFYYYYLKMFTQEFKLYVFSLFWLSKRDEWQIRNCIIESGYNILIQF